MVRRLLDRWAARRLLDRLLKAPPNTILDKNADDLTVEAWLWDAQGEHDMAMRVRASALTMRVVHDMTERPRYIDHLLGPDHVHKWMEMGDGTHRWMECMYGEIKDHRASPKPFFEGPN